MKDLSQVYVIGDMHGCKDLLERIHKKIVKKSKNAEGHKILIYLGDYVDRGSKVKETIETIINFKPKSFKCIFIFNPTFISTPIIKIFNIFFELEGA